MDQKLYDELFQKFVDEMVSIIKNEGITDYSAMEECVAKNVCKLDIRIRRNFFKNHDLLFAFLDDAYESVGLATNIEID